jgi:transporter family-2 protein
MKKLIFRRRNMGYIMSVIAGAAMSIQGVMNTRLSEKIGLYESNAYVQGTAFLLSLIAMWIFGKGSFNNIGSVNKLYLLGGLFGLIITVTVMIGVGRLSPTIAISVILISQLLVAAIIDAFGLMGSEKITFTWNKYVGLFLMIAGVLFFKWKK